MQQTNSTSNVLLLIVLSLDLGPCEISSFHISIYIGVIIVQVLSKPLFVSPLPLVL